jgi:hypothetical protein
MNFCGQCGDRVRPQSVFCAGCGTQLRGTSVQCETLSTSFAAGSNVEQLPLPKTMTSSTTGNRKQQRARLRRWVLAFAAIPALYVVFFIVMGVSYLVQVELTQTSTPANRRNSAASIIPSGVINQNETRSESPTFSQSPIPPSQPHPLLEQWIALFARQRDGAECYVIWQPSQGDWSSFNGRADGIRIYAALKGVALDPATFMKLSDAPTTARCYQDFESVMTYFIVRAG